MNRGRMKDMVRMLLAIDPVDAFVIDAEINDMLNESQVHVATETLGLTTYKGLETQEGVERYSLPADFLALRDVQMWVSVTDDTDKRTLEKCGYDSYEEKTRRYTTPGIPKFFKIEFGATSVSAAIPGDIWLRPIPDSNGGNNYRLRLAMYQKPDDMTDDTHICMLPESMHWCVCYHAAWVISERSL